MEQALRLLATDNSNNSLLITNSQPIVDIHNNSTPPCHMDRLWVDGKDTKECGQDNNNRNKQWHIDKEQRIEPQHQLPMDTEEHHAV
jgi:hypothetical protein